MLLNHITNFQNNFLIKILMRINKNKILIFVIFFSNECISANPQLVTKVFLNFFKVLLF